MEGKMKQEITLRLPNGNYYKYWEKEQKYEKELHVDTNHIDASDENDGTKEHPFKTINAAASIADPGTRVWIHGGIYRECVHPARGGEGKNKMICYEAYNEEEVVIKASVIAKRFKKSKGWELTPFSTEMEAEHIKVWEIKLEPDEFKGYNPFCAVNILHDRLFIEYDKTDMTTYLNRRGMVFCDGKPLKQVSLYHQLNEYPGSYWVEANGQTVHFRLEKDDTPFEHMIELSCREQCFAPEIPFLSYIKVKGLTCVHAATGAPVPQRGSISCYRGHHWVIEDCTIDWSNGVGIDIGNECWHHSMVEGQRIGSSVIRRCKIYHAGVCGIAGLFAKDLLIEDNLIQNTGWQRMELSWEAGGIKIHNCENSIIRRNIFTKTIGADHLWLDVENENNRITQNLFLDGKEQREAIFIECTRNGINLIDNNIFWNIEGRFKPSEIPKEPGSLGWYKMEESNVVNGYAVYGEGTDHIHIVNNFIGKCRSSGYFAKTAAFRIVGNSRGGTSRDSKIWNNIFYDCKEAAIKFPTQWNESEGNLFLNMPGGYLRILYPAPEECLDLKAWQEFHGFDLQGQEGFFDVLVDTECFTMKFLKKKDFPKHFFHFNKEDRYIFNVEEVQPIKVNEIAPNDFYGNIAANGLRIPGPFLNLIEEQVISIDPRRL
jgi:hypothetical protein